jgi:hypothetical protein
MKIKQFTTENGALIQIKDTDAVFKFGSTVVVTKDIGSAIKLMYAENSSMPMEIFMKVSG